MEGRALSVEGHRELLRAKIIDTTVLVLNKPSLVLFSHGSPEILWENILEKDTASAGVVGQNTLG